MTRNFKVQRSQIKNFDFVMLIPKEQSQIFERMNLQQSKQSTKKSVYYDSNVNVDVMPDFSAFQMFGKKMFLRLFVKKQLQKFRIHFNLIKTTLSLREYFALFEPVQQLWDYGRAHAS